MAQAQELSPSASPSNAGSISEQFVYSVSAVPEWKPKPAYSSTYCSCVNYAKAVVGRTGEVWGNAWHITPTALEPAIGSLILTREGRGHVGVVTGITWESVTFTEANFFACQKSVRTLALNDLTIRGYKPITETPQ